MSDVESELAAVIDEIRAHAAAIEELTPKRDRLIRRAIKARLPRARIVTITQLSPARIDQIRRASRQ